MEPKEGKAPDVALDIMDCRLLRQLGQNGRLSFAELGRRVGLSAAAVRARVQALEASGVIRGYRADIDPSKVGRPLLAFIRLRPHFGQSEKARRFIEEEVPGLLECHAVAGRDCYLLKLTARSVEDLKENARRLRACGETETAIVLSSPVPSRPVEPPEAAGRS